MNKSPFPIMLFFICMLINIGSGCKSEKKEVSVANNPMKVDPNEYLKEIKLPLWVQNCNVRGKCGRSAFHGA